MAAAFSTSALNLVGLSAVRRKAQIDLLWSYLNNINKKFKPWEWDSFDNGKWERVHGDLKSKTNGRVTTWLLKGHDGKYHWAMLCDLPKAYTPEGSTFVRGSFDVKPTEDEVMTDIKAKIKDKYGLDVDA